MIRLWIFISLLFLGSASWANASMDSMSEKEKISYLLDIVGSSKVIFIRNGVEYPPKEAKAHLQMKLDTAGASIQTAEDFITKIASPSYLTGAPYYVEFPDGTKIEAEKWLRALEKQISQMRVHKE